MPDGLRIKNRPIWYNPCKKSRSRKNFQNRLDLELSLPKNQRHPYGALLMILLMLMPVSYLTLLVSPKTVKKKVKELKQKNTELEHEIEMVKAKRASLKEHCQSLTANLEATEEAQKQVC